MFTLSATNNVAEASATIYIDDIYLGRTTSSATSFPSEVVQTLATINPGSLRFMSPVQLGTNRGWKAKAAARRRFDAGYARQLRLPAQAGVRQRHWGGVGLLAGRHLSAGGAGRCGALVNTTSSPITLTPAFPSTGTLPQTAETVLYTNGISDNNAKLQRRFRRPPPGQYLRLRPKPHPHSPTLLRRRRLLTGLARGESGTRYLSVHVPT